MYDASLAHRGRDSFDGSAERVQQLGHLARAVSLPALLHDEAGQGADIRVEGRLVRHGWGLIQVRAAGAGCRCRQEGPQVMLTAGVPKAAQCLQKLSELESWGTL